MLRRTCPYFHASLHGIIDWDWITVVAFWTSFDGAAKRLFTHRFCNFCREEWTFSFNAMGRILKLTLGCWVFTGVLRLNVWRKSFTTKMGFGWCFGIWVSTKLAINTKTAFSNPDWALARNTTNWPNLRKNRRVMKFGLERAKNCQTQPQKWTRWARILVAQSSATGVTVAAIPPCSAIRFRNPKVPRYPRPARRAPCLLRTRGKCDRAVRREVRHLDLGGVARFWRDISDSAGICCDTLCATLCSAIGVSTRMCH